MVESIVINHSVYLDIERITNMRIIVALRFKDSHEARKASVSNKNHAFRVDKCFKLSSVLEEIS
jgi:hypothetical protein